MNPNKSKLDEYVSEEVNKYKGVSRPLRASLLRRLFIRFIACKKLHPNPDDEFCDPSIGPNNEILSNYAETIRVGKQKERDARFFDEPVLVERMYPEGYMLLNGHHRWGAAIRMGLPKIRVKIVNPSHLDDIHQMLERTTHDKRVTLDLDEVVLVADPAREEAEKALPFPLNLYYKRRIRRGIPALFSFLRMHGYDVWVYSAEYDSPEHIRHGLALYHAPIDGIVTGMGRKNRFTELEKKKLEAMIAKQYARTIHIDGNSLVCIDGQTKAFEDYALSGNRATWSQEIMEIIGALEKQ